jgi:hypothetical protein
MLPGSAHGGIESVFHGTLSEWVPGSNATHLSKENKPRIIELRGTMFIEGHMPAEKTIDSACTKSDRVLEQKGQQL